jgi:hypothetical protein
MPDKPRRCASLTRFMAARGVPFTLVFHRHHESLSETASIPVAIQRLHQQYGHIRKSSSELPR